MGDREGVGGRVAIHEATGVADDPNIEVTGGLLRHDFALPVKEDVAAELGRRGHLEVANGRALRDFLFAGVVVDLDLVFGVDEPGIGDPIRVADVDDDR